LNDTESILNPNPPPGRPDPARAKEDIQVAAFYIGSGDYQGAFLRYKDAFAADPGSIQALFGMAEAARLMGRIAEARRDYKLYLSIEPKGGESKKALKALASLPPG
jgi:Tfp pilus assembly protein PilF